MLRTVEQLRGLEIAGEDGPIGSLEDVYLDHQDWRLRHAVVFTGSWLSGRWIVLPSPLLHGIDPARRGLRVATARMRVGAAPAPETDRLSRMPAPPLSRIRRPESRILADFRGLSAILR